jgi:hypothetical protein
MAVLIIVDLVESTNRDKDYGLVKLLSVRHPFSLPQCSCNNWYALLSVILTHNQEVRYKSMVCICRSS